MDKESLMNLKTYKKYIIFDKAIYIKYKNIMSKKDIMIYNNISKINGFGGYCKYASNKENIKLDKLWIKYLHELSQYDII